MPTVLTASRFVEELQAKRSPEQREKYQRHFQTAEGQYGEGDAFTSDVHVVGIVSAIFYAGLAVLAIRAFKHVRNIDGGDDDTTNEDRVTDSELETASATEAKNRHTRSQRGVRKRPFLKRCARLVLRSLSQRGHKAG